MHVFETQVVWQQDKACEVKSSDRPALTVATPPEFGGPEGVWTPEHLLVAAVDSCLLSTFLYFADRFKLPLRSYASAAQGRVEKTLEGLRFTGIDVSIRFAVADAKAVQKAMSLRLQEKLEKYCPVSASLGCPVRLDLDVSQADDVA
jgi:organic hydroperoxide reductase OsmC/OhrA